MKKFLDYIPLAATALAVLCCSPRNVEPEHVAGEYSRSLAVINEDYYELLVLNEITSVAPVTISSVDNFPYWLSVEADGELNSHPVLQLTVKKNADMQASREIEGSVTLSTGDVIKLKVKQDEDLPTGFNADDVLTSINTEFEADWAGCKKISLVTSNVDVNGQTQVTTTEVALPWATSALTEEWLPEGEAERMVAGKDQWELVFNLTGMESRPNYNYFGLYNKYTGKLRIFYYMDQAHIPSNDTNDHMWSLYFSDALAEFPVFQFGIPYSVSVGGSYKQVIGSPNIQYMTSATTSQMSQSYKVTPRVGWWAYDVDMSQLRPTAMTAKNGYITPGLLLYAQDNVYLNSFLKGDINGSINGNINLNALAPSAVNGTGFSLTNIVGRGENLFSTQIMAYMLMGQISAGPMSIAAARGALGACMGLAGMMNVMDGTEDPDMAHLGQISLDAFLSLNAEMETQGSIGGNRSNKVSSPKIPWDYIKPDTHFGEGVWNIENTPVIYVLSDAYWSDVKNFLTFELAEEKDASGKVVRTYFKTVKDPSLLNIRQISFLDPTSMGRVFLNDKVYDHTETPVQVFQSFGVFPGASAGYTKDFRTSLGIPARTAVLANAPFDTKTYKDIVWVKLPVDDNLFQYDIPSELAEVMAPRQSQQADASNPELVRRYFGPSMYYFKVNPPVTEVDQVQYVSDPQVKLPYVVKDLGDGKKEYLLYNPDYVDWVVTVNIQVRQEERTHVLTRAFLPEVRVISYKELPALIDQMKARRSQLSESVDYVAADEIIGRVRQYYDTITKN